VNRQLQLQRYPPDFCDLPEQRKCFSSTDLIALHLETCKVIFIRIDCFTQNPLTYFSQALDCFSQKNSLSGYVLEQRLDTRNPATKPRNIERIVAVAIETAKICSEKVATPLRWISSLA
jgi:hypothetical protein